MDPMLPILLGSAALAIFQLREYYRSIFPAKIETQGMTVLEYFSIPHSSFEEFLDASIKEVEKGFRPGSTLIALHIPSDYMNDIAEKLRKKYGHKYEISCGSRSGVYITGGYDDYLTTYKYLLDFKGYRFLDETRVKDSELCMKLCSALIELYPERTFELMMSDEFFPPGEDFMGEFGSRLMIVVDGYRIRTPKPEVSRELDLNDAIFIKNDENSTVEF